MRFRFLVLLAVASAWACGGDDNTDAGSDATSDQGSGGDSGQDVTVTDTGGNDGAGNDGAGNDAAPIDAASDGSTMFACGTATCDSKTQYCQKAQKGLDGGIPDAAVLPDASKIDGGTIEVDTCLVYPTSCTADGGTPSCTCVTATNCTCKQSGADITQTCP